MDNEQDRSKVAYGDGPKEVNTKRGMPKSKQFGGNEKAKMPQDSNVATRAYVKEELVEHNKKYHHGEKPYNKRHKEHR